MGIPNSKSIETYVFPTMGVDTEYFTENKAVGRVGGSPFTFIKLNEGASLNKIKVWYDWAVIGVEVWMTDGSNFSAGCCNGDSQEFSFIRGDRITSLNIPVYQHKKSFSNKSRDEPTHWNGSIMFETTHNCYFQLKEKNSELYESIKLGTYQPDVGSGICCGIFGAAAEDFIYSLGFAMLRKFKNAVLTNVKYPTLDKTFVETQYVPLASQQFINTTEEYQTFRISGSKTINVTRKWSGSLAESFSISIAVKACIPNIASVGGMTERSVSITDDYQQTSKTSETKSWDFPLRCPPRTIIYGMVMMYNDIIRTEFEADLQLHLDSGNDCRLKVTGEYHFKKAGSRLTVEINVVK